MKVRNTGAERGKPGPAPLYGSRMSVRAIRCPDDLWQAVREAAEARGESIGSWVRRAVERGLSPPG